MPPKRRVKGIPRKAASPNSVRPLPSPPHPPTAPVTPIPTSETPDPVALNTPIPPPPPAANPSTPLLAATNPTKPASATADPSTPPTAATNPPPDAAAKPTTTRKVRKIIKKVIIKRIVPKGTLAARKAAAAAAAEASKPADKTLSKKPANDCNAAVSKSADKMLPEKPPTDSNAAAVDEAAVKEGEGEDAEMSERRNRRKKEVFVGGLDRNTKEEDVREVFGRAGEIEEVRMVVDAQTGRNKGFCFVRYREAAQAKKAITEFGRVEICGKLCGAEALDGNDTIFLGNINKKWKKEDIIKLLQDIGVKNIDTITLMADPNNPGCNRGFAFLELETNRDALLAYKKLTKKDVFGKGVNLSVDWAEPLNDPDEEQMQKVKSIFVDGIPTFWNRAKLTESFKKYGTIERVVLSRDIQSAKRKDFAFVNYTTREAAMLCLESFDKEKLTENDSKVNIKVSLAKPVQKGKHKKGERQFSCSGKDKPKIAQSETKARSSSVKIGSSRLDETKRDNKSTTTHELLHVLREQAAWRQGNAGYSSDPAIEDYSHIYSGEKRAFSSLGDDSPHPDARGYPHPRYESSTYPTAISSYDDLPHDIGRYSQPYYHNWESQYPIDSNYGKDLSSINSQTRLAGPHQAGPPHGSRQYKKY